MCSTGGVSDEAQAVDVVPTESPIPDGLRVAKSLLLVNTGDGKGKSTAAFGTMLRAVAQGWPVAVVQFLKSGDWKVGEEKIGRELGVDWWALGDGFTWDSENLDESTAIAQEAWRAAMEHINSNKYRLVILDEVTYPMNWGWIDPAEVVSTLINRPEKVSVICTGRNASPELMAAADTVTEMVKVTHAYDQGIRAKKGIDY
jgi:cob(I)alamin adenosyltransferase